MGKWFELHKHTQYSMFDGFDSVKNVVAYAKELGMPAMGISDHGNACGILHLYSECKTAGIKPIMGCEVYFQPVFNAANKYYHLCLFAKNAIGYKNLCQIISIANRDNFYRYPKVTFELLEQFHEGIICTTACVAGFISKHIMQYMQSSNTADREMAVKAIKKFKKIFGPDLYFELMPIKIDDLGTQEYVNKSLIILGKEYNIKCIITTDSHYTRKADFDSYLMMHKMSKIGSAKGEGFTIEHIENTYRERYMHSENDITKKFEDMHGISVKPFLNNMEEIYNKIDVDLNFSDSFPLYPDCAYGEDAYMLIKRISIGRLKELGLYTKEYIDRLKYELSVIRAQNLCDYFMIVWDYMKYAREHNIYVGPGRGSVCGSLVPYALQITKVDPILHSTDFERFLRPDKKKIPDIDLDFENGRQTEVQNYIVAKYPGSACKIITFGYYKGANLINDLGKVYEMSAEKTAHAKALLIPLLPDMMHFGFEELNFEDAIKNKQIAQLNRDYPNYVKHFCRLCGQVKYYGQHPAGVLVTNGPIGEWVPLMKVRENLLCSIDHLMVEGLGMVKFDILALKTMNILHEIEDVTGDVFESTQIEPNVEKEIYNRFSTGNTLGIFQLNKPTAQDILSKLHADTFDDIVAAISLNRPGTLRLKMHEQYAENKRHVNKKTIWYPYTQDAYGTVIYQEHVMRICKQLAKMDPGVVDKIMKFKFNEQERAEFKRLFIVGAREHSSINAQVAGPLFDSMALYMFNKGHAAGYAMISLWEMYHKVKHPTEFWYAILKNEFDERMQVQFMTEAVVDGIVIFLPHVNYSASYTIRKVEGENIIQQGYNTIKNVGEKAAMFIQNERKENGRFVSYDDFYDRCKNRSVTSRVIDSLLEQGALEFNKKMYESRVQKYNSSLYMKGMR